MHHAVEAEVQIDMEQPLQQGLQLFVLLDHAPPITSLNHISEFPKSRHRTALVDFRLVRRRFGFAFITVVSGARILS